MGATYAVTWHESDEATSHSGKLELLPRGLRLEGRANGAGSIVTEIGYDDLSEVRVGRIGTDRIGDRPTLVLERRSGGRVRIASVAQSGIVAELAERLARRLVARRGTIPVVVILPLKAGTPERVRDLIAQGPPFDPGATGLERHEVFVTDREAVLIFEAASQSAVERLVRVVDVWAAAAAWQHYVAGPARLADVASAWARTPALGADISFAAASGPGDGEGGDVFDP